MGMIERRVPVPIKDKWNAGSAPAPLCAALFELPQRTLPRSFFSSSSLLLLALLSSHAELRLSGISLSLSINYTRGEWASSVRTNFSFALVSFFRVEWTNYERIHAPLYYIMHSIKLRVHAPPPWSASRSSRANWNAVTRAAAPLAAFFNEVWWYGGHHEKKSWKFIRIFYLKELY